MRNISNEEAEKNHKIITFHQEMDGGESRFRLKKITEGTAYIRTEATDKGGWQKSHFHNYVRETYIVQKGWIGYAEFADGTVRTSAFYAGELFTTKPKIIHNIYMSANSITHTVKHGNIPDESTEDRIVDEETMAFDKITDKISEENIKKPLQKGIEENNIGGRISDTSLKETYTPEYRHFDTMIWQLPAWCTAIFLLSIHGINSITDSNIIIKENFLSKKMFLTSFLLAVFLFIMILNHVLYRFRWHQAILKRYKKTPVWTSAQTYLQFMVTLQASLLLAITLLINGLAAKWISLICLMLILTNVFYREYRITRRKSEII